VGDPESASHHDRALVDFADLAVKCAEVVEEAEADEDGGEEVDEAGAPLGHVEAVDAEGSEEGEQEPGDGVVEMARLEAEVGLAIHAGDEKQIDNPADEEEPQGEEPDGSRDGFAIVEAMGSHESEDPQDIADQHGVGVVGVGHGRFFRAFGFGGVWRHGGGATVCRSSPFGTSSRKAISFAYLAR